ncbi:RNA polymerase sigma factor [Aeoliella mucimassa]|uniref:RNA polymerase sigma factor n=1 Tax=Aeoliella mucimassa TaxID=2527972 RepID=UPI001E569344|nr:sigma-70 family RNA polymerase sigma factor [Aeoliella mucimassa]
MKYLTDQLGDAGVDVVGALFDLTSQRLVRLAVAITRNQCDAEDAVQAVMVRIATRPHQLHSARCAWAYLLQMVRHEALTVLRKRKRLRGLGSLADLVIRRRVDEIELQETNRAVWSALRTLPAEQAEVVVLKIWEEMTFQEIGEILEISPNTAASRYKYALNKLSAKLAGRREEVLHD